MGVGYQVSPLHRIAQLDVPNLRLQKIVPGKDPNLDSLAAIAGVDTVATPPIHTRSPTVQSILAWRRLLETKYHDELGDKLNWNERSSFEDSEDVATHADVLFHYVAAVVDQRGREWLEILRDQENPRDMENVFAEADRRGFGGRFPQLLLGARIWLPFERNLMVEEPDWNGNVNRYGSVFRLIDEITAARAALEAVDPSVVGAVESETTSQNILATAWQTSCTVLRLATIAGEKHLPLLTTG